MLASTRADAPCWGMELGSEMAQFWDSYSSALENNLRRMNSFYHAPKKPKQTWVSLHDFFKRCFAYLFSLSASVTWTVERVMPSPFPLLFSELPV